MRPNDLANAYYLRGHDEAGAGRHRRSDRDLDQPLPRTRTFRRLQQPRDRQGLVQDGAGAVDDFTHAIASDANAGRRICQPGPHLPGHAQSGLGAEGSQPGDRAEAGLGDGLFDRASIRQKTVDLDAAIEDLTKAITSRPTTPTRTLTGPGLRSPRQPRFALDDYNKIIELRPDSADAYANRGIDKYRQNDMDAAIADFTKPSR